MILYLQCVSIARAHNVCAELCAYPEVFYFDRMYVSSFVLIMPLPFQSSWPFEKLSTVLILQCEIFLITQTSEKGEKTSLFD